jgi:hypothetical protein
MHRQTLAALFLPVACAVLFAGCYSTQKTGTWDPSFVTESLYSVVLLTGEEIIFGEEGGKYRLSASVSGVTASGTLVSIPASAITEIRTWRPPAIPFDSARAVAVAEILLKDSALVEFEPPGARFDEKRGAFVGRNKRNSEFVGFRPGIVLEYRALAGTPYQGQLFSADTTLRIAEVILEQPRFKALSFDSNGGRVGSVTEWIVGKTQSGSLVHIPMADVLYGTIRRADAAKTTIGIIGGTVAIAAVVAAIVVATKQSCPFLYSYDGAQYRFDAEPLGGATTEGLARTDYSRLKYLRPVEGTYRVLMRNEVHETQYVDAISLCVVDHDPSRMPVAAGENSFHLLPAPVPAASISDEQGTDLSRFLSKNDGIAWQTHLDGLPASPENVRQTITFRFVKPAAARRAQLVVRGGTTPWGSNVIRLLYELLGTDVDRWYADADRRGPELYKLLNYLDAEELYTLKVYVQKKEGWAQRGTIDGGGPFVHETQAVPLNVAGIDGDTLAVQIRPPLGFWSFDFAGVVFDNDSVCTVTEVPLRSATDQDGKDIAGLLSSNDRRYFELPTNNEEAILTFAVPPERPGLARTVFAKTTGYYRLHLNNTEPPQTAMMERLGTTQGEIVRYSLEKYRQWVGTLRAQLRAGRQQ